MRDHEKVLFGDFSTKPGRRSLPGSIKAEGKTCRKTINKSSSSILSLSTMMFFKAAALAALSFFPIAAVAQSGTGSATFYHPGTAQGACGMTNTDSDHVVAVSTQIFNNGLCNKNMNVSYQGKSVQVKVVDSCPGCGPNDIDLSPSAFSVLADQSVGRIQVDWKIV
ncbi:hypothetical protein VKT23_008824 [Stygiomarasmius scandens]|uniref:RlpA-like protein double-psi beta-barrel domain-containing protein n=1 Tax=Marasmiellus scandens TaxID=2682957 RepID=A0ABR1JFP5_9AGAR